mgnify:CR=1 FL=1
MPDVSLYGRGMNPAVYGGTPSAPGMAGVGSGPPPALNSGTMDAMKMMEMMMMMKKMQQQGGSSKQGMGAMGGGGGGMSPAPAAGVETYGAL